jgi:hypothetical protein
LSANKVYVISRIFHMVLREKAAPFSREYFCAVRVIVRCISGSEEEYLRRRHFSVSFKTVSSTPHTVVSYNSFHLFLSLSFYLHSKCRMQLLKGCSIIPVKSSRAEISFLFLSTLLRNANVAK